VIKPEIAQRLGFRPAHHHPDLYAVPLPDNKPER